ncbi:DUF2125 domain-containing protein [Rhodobium gokarnense]|uniref:DUF2125 domain-containing protein n=1 Tax=Rhodobium gokarnense TaxID=364296 RepID=A0ABT3HDU2_9HYPH|nr:DUF2125 domain-containing protein [Rhodobium gokarnense]MCW2308577.1 hypothetical protein [Rhodobium gokarnense]
MTEAPRRSRSTRIFVLAVAGVIAVIAAWSAAWWYIADTAETVIDRTLADLRRGGTVVACGGREIGGWPFRLEVRCAPLRLKTPDGFALKVAAARAVALVYNPRHIIVETDAPAEIDAGGRAPGAIAWSLGHASVVIGDNGPRELSVALEDPRVSGFGPLGLKDVAATNAQFHMREAPDRPGTLDVALSVSDLVESPVPLGAPIGAGLEARLPANVMANASRPVTLAAPSPDGPALDITRAHLEAETARLALDGHLTLNAAGAPEGTLDLEVTDASRVTAILRRLVPADPAKLESIEGAITGFGRKTEVDGKTVHVLPIRIRNGQASLGLIPLFRLPSIGG